MVGSLFLWEKFQTGSPSQSNPSDLPAPPKWEPLAVHANFIFLPRPLPLGEVDLRSKDGEGEDASRSAALSQKAALQMLFPSTTPPVKMRLERSAERDKREIKNNFSAEYG